MKQFLIGEQDVASIDRAGVLLRELISLAPKNAFLEQKWNKVLRDLGEVNPVPSEEECEHEFDPSEGFTCLNCGKDGAEEVLSAAYDRAKDLKKYGH